MGRKFIWILAVVSVVGGLAGGAMADILGESPHGKQVQASGPKETFKSPAKDDAVLSKVQIDGRTYSEKIWKGDIDGH